MNLDKTELKWMLNTISRRIQDADEAFILNPTEDIKMVQKWLRELHKKIQGEYYK